MNEFENGEARKRRIQQRADELNEAIREGREKGLRVEVGLDQTGKVVVDVTLELP